MSVNSRGLEREHCFANSLASSPFNNADFSRCAERVIVNKMVKRIIENGFMLSEMHEMPKLIVPTISVPFANFVQ